MTADLISDLVRILLCVLMAAWSQKRAVSGYARLMADADEDALNVNAWIDMALGVTLVVMCIVGAWSIAAGQM